MEQANTPKSEVFFDINEFIREKIGLLSYEANKNGYFNDDCAVIISDFLLNASKSKKKVNKDFTEHAMTCMYADTYKIINFRKKNNTHDYNDDFLLEQLKNVEGKDEIVESINNPNVLFEFVKNELEFIKLNELGKINLFKHLNETDHRNIIRVNDSHRFDLKIYDNYIDTNRYISFYKEMTDTDIDDVSDPIEDIEAFMRKLYYTDRKNFNNNYKDMLKTYYKWNKFTTYNDPKVIEISDRLRMISLIEKNTLEDLENVSLENNHFLYTIIDEYIYRALNPIEFIKRSDYVEAVTEEKVDSFISKNTNKTVLNKLGFENKTKKK